MIVSRYVHESLTPNNGLGFARSTATGKLDSYCVSSWSHEQCLEFAARQNVSATLFDAVAATGAYDIALFGRVDVGAGVLDDYLGGNSTQGDGFHFGPDYGILARAAGIEGLSDTDPLDTFTQDDAEPYAGDAFEAAAAVTWITARTPSEKPFFLWVGLLDPHPPYNTNQSFLHQVNCNDNCSLASPAQPDWAAMHPYDITMSRRKDVVAEYTAHQLKEMRKAYWGACAEALGLLADVISAANASGNLDNTVILFTSDHGEMSLEYRQDYKNSLREPSARVPLLVAAYGAAAVALPMAAGTGTTCLNLTSHLDIVPTLIDLVGGVNLPGARGTSLVPILQSGAAALPTQPPGRLARKTFVVSEYHSDKGSTGAYMIRQDQWKLITYGHRFPWFTKDVYVDQLFDLNDDPFEFTNVASTNPTVVAALFATLEAELGGAGSVERIDTELTDLDLLMWARFIVNGTATRNAVIAKLMLTFRNDTASAAEVEAQVAMWEAFGDAA